MTTGVLVLVGKKNNLFVKFTNTKGNQVQLPIKENELSQALTQKKRSSITELNELEVEFEEIGGQPRQVREKGKTWESPQPSSITSRQQATASPATRTTNNAGIRRGDFHNPYNFIPAPPRNTAHPELGDSKPVGHGSYRPDYWSGRISVTLTTKTPLLIPDAANLKEDNNHHKTYPIRVGADGKPYLPPTSIKGMLRSAYEAVTNSRLSIFEKHEDRLAYRMPAQVGPVPARVEKRGDSLFLRIMREPQLIGHAAKLQRYRVGHNLPPDKGESRVATRYDSSNQLPQHGSSVWVRLNQGKVTRIREWTQNPPNEGDWEKGWVCITGPNVNSKKYERVFVESDDNQLIPITENIESLWEELIRNYQQTHEKELEKRDEDNISPQMYLGGEPGKTGWSRHIYEESEVKLREGTLCYVEFNGSEITAVQPVTISRRLYAIPPEQLLDPSLKPATCTDKLSPADRVFGWVKQKKGKGSSSYKGNLRIGSVTCQSDDAIEGFGDDGFPLAILGQPKPQQTRFYVAQDKQGSPLDNGVSKDSGYRDASLGLRGRKVYPHHNGLPQDYWENPTQDRTQAYNKGHFQEYRRPDFKDQTRDDQNRSIKAWVKPEVTFEFNIDVTNLSDVELGALLWLLTLPEDHYHRLGGGKPLGFGSVRLNIDWTETDLRKGEDWREFYSSLFPVIQLEASTAENCIQRFKDAVSQAYGNSQSFERVSFIAAFCRSTKGFEDNLPIHYPRARQNGQTGPVPPHREGKAFEWFVANERRDYQVALPNLVSDRGLPMLNANPEPR